MNGRMGLPPQAAVSSRCRFASRRARRRIRCAGPGPRAAYEDDPELKAAIGTLASGAFSGADREATQQVLSSILGWDEYLVLADYRSYIDCHDQAVGPAWADRDRWTRMSILNTARSGYFSSDRTVRAEAFTS